MTSSTKKTKYYKNYFNKEYEKDNLSGCKKNIRKNSSNIPTGANSNVRTPKSSFDKADNNINFEPHIVYEKLAKLSNRKWSSCSENENEYKSRNDFRSKYKTELCKYYEMNGTCKYGENVKKIIIFNYFQCAYAHGKENLRERFRRSSAYRTKKCIQFFENGFCPYGSRCQFAHIDPNKETHSYKALMGELMKKNNPDFKPKRLEIFNNICNVSSNDVTIASLDEEIEQISKDSIYEEINQDINLEMFSPEEEEEFIRILGI